MVQLATLHRGRWWLTFVLAAGLGLAAGCGGRGGPGGRPSAPSKLDAADTAYRADYQRKVEEFMRAADEAERTGAWADPVSKYHSVAADEYRKRVAPDLLFDVRARGLAIAEAALPALRARVATDPAAQQTAASITTFEGIRPELKAEYEALLADAGRGTHERRAAQAAEMLARGRYLIAGVLMAESGGDRDEARRLLEMSIVRGTQGMAWDVPPVAEEAVAKVLIPRWLHRVPLDADPRVVARLTAGELEFATRAEVGQRSFTEVVSSRELPNPRVAELDRQIAMWTNEYEQASSAYRGSGSNTAGDRALAANQQLARLKYERDRAPATIVEEETRTVTRAGRVTVVSASGHYQLEILVDGHVAFTDDGEVSGKAYTFDDTGDAPDRDDAIAAFWAEAGKAAGELLDGHMTHRYVASATAARALPPGSDERIEQMLLACLEVWERCHQDGFAAELQAAGIPAPELARFMISSVN
jgi:hypothetical protein